MPSTREVLDCDITGVPREAKALSRRFAGQCVAHSYLSTEDLDCYIIMKTDVLHTNGAKDRALESMDAYPTFWGLAVPLISQVHFHLLWQVDDDHIDPKVRDL